jgi:hypothetical protein
MLVISGTCRFQPYPHRTSSDYFLRFRVISILMYHLRYRARAELRPCGSNFARSN